MKKILFTLFALLVMLSSINCQSPEGFKYQALIRDTNNLILSNQIIDMRFIIQQGNIGGSVVYTETFETTSNNYGLVNLEISSGITSNDFSIIDWANGPYFLETSVDLFSSGQWSVIGTSQLMSVPYAFHSNTSDSIVGGINSLEIDPLFSSSVANSITAADTARWNSFLDTKLDSIGISNLGYIAGPKTIDTDTQLDSIGISNLGYVAGPKTIDTDTQLDSTGISNLGYIAGPKTIDTQIDSIGISNFGYVAEKIYSIGLWPELGGYVFRISSDGKHGLVAEVQDQSISPVIWYGSDNLINNPANHSLDAQKFCNWRMPTKVELNEMYIHKSSIGGFLNSFYWSSTAYNINLVYWQDFSLSSNGLSSQSSKDGPLKHVRGVREF